MLGVSLYGLCLCSVPGAACYVLANVDTPEEYVSRNALAGTWRVLSRGKKQALTALNSTEHEHELTTFFSNVHFLSHSVGSNETTK